MNGKLWFIYNDSGLTSVCESKSSAYYELSQVKKTVSIDDDVLGIPINELNDYFEEFEFAKSEGLI